MVKSNFLKSHKKLIIFCSVVLVIALAITGRLLYERHVVNEMRQIADQFVVPSEWKLTSEHHLEPLLFCVADEPCPHYRKSWDTQDTITEKDIDDIVDTTQWSNTITEGCMTIAKQKSLVNCTKVSQYGRFEIKIDYLKDQSGKHSGNIYLDIKKQ